MDFEFSPLLHICYSFDLGMKSFILAWRFTVYGDVVRKRWLEFQSSNHACIQVTSIWSLCDVCIG